MTWFRRLMMVFDIILHGLLSMAKYGVPLAMLVAAVLFFQEVRGMVTSVTSIFGWGHPKDERPLDERVVSAKDKCRAYTMLANVVGAKSKLEQDKTRVLCTAIRLEETGVDPCDIFHDQMELVPPGWGRRMMGVYNPFLGRYTYVPKRQFWYIEKEFSKAEVDISLQLAKKTKDQNLCPANWKATTIVRPVREKTLGNQRDDELAAIRKMVPQVVEAKQSDFEFYRPK